MRRTPLLFFGLAVASEMAHAHGEAVIFASLLWIGLFGGVLAGALSAIGALPRFGASHWFLLYLALLAVAGAAVLQSLEVIPYAMGYGAFFGVIPFFVLFHVARYAATTVRAYRSARTVHIHKRLQSPKHSQDHT